MFYTDKEKSSIWIQRASFHGMTSVLCSKGEMKQYVPLGQIGQGAEKNLGREAKDLQKVSCALGGLPPIFQYRLVIHVSRKFSKQHGMLKRGGIIHLFCQIRALKNVPKSVLCTILVL